MTADQVQVDSLVREGYAAQAAGSLDVAERCYEQILCLQPDHHDALYLLGALALSSGDSERAVELLSKASAARPDEAAFRDDLARASNNFGCLLRNRGETGRAREYFEAAVRAMPDLAEAHYNLANILRELGDAGGAIEHFRAAAQAQPGQAKVWNNLGCALQTLGRVGEAAEAFRRAIDAEPGYGIGHKNLAGALREIGQLDEAAQVYERALTLLPQDPAIPHYLSALRNLNPERASATYVKEMFDLFARDFDETLVNHLGYRTPELLFQAICGALGQVSQGQKTLDLGCGSGLFGAHAKSFSSKLVGVDLSTEMIRKATQRGCYDRLEEGDLLDFLAAEPPAGFDLAAAVDVLVYFGNLSAVFDGVRRVLKSGGIFAYSVEADLESKLDFRLRPTGRYCHTSRYLEKLAQARGFSQVAFSQAVLRTENGAGIQGYLCVLRKA